MLRGGDKGKYISYLQAEGLYIKKNKKNKVEVKYL